MTIGTSALTRTPTSLQTVTIVPKFKNTPHLSKPKQAGFLLFPTSDRNNADRHIYF